MYFSSYKYRIECIGITYRDEKKFELRDSTVVFVVNSSIYTEFNVPIILCREEE